MTVMNSVLSKQQVVSLSGNSSVWMSRIWGRCRAHKGILNVAASGKFSSDRTMGEYAKQIWDTKPCPLI